MRIRNVGAMAFVAFVCACGPAHERDASPSDRDSIDGGATQTDLRDIVERAPRLPLQAVALRVLPPDKGWRLGRVSWIAADQPGLIYLLQRGADVDPVVVVDADGHVLRSWGKGDYTMAHAIRIDPEGNVWTVDAATSMVRKYTPDGRTLMEIAVGGRPSVCMDQQIVPESERATGPNDFCGATDVAFAPNGHVFIADGYANDRILEYSSAGKKLNEWGSAGTGPGQFRLPHSIRIDEGGTIYVADRENGRIERFDLTGKYLGEWSNLGRVYSLEIREGAMWIVTQPLDLPNSAPGWLLKLDRATGKVLGYVEAAGGHGMVALADGELLVGPGPDGAPPWRFRPIP
jgi:6-bladed beta-propeller